MQFFPWVGDKYKSEGLRGVRILALGESHYEGVIPTSHNYTSDVVREWVFNRRKAYFTKIAKLLEGIGPGVHIKNEALQGIWGRISFYNYVQQMLPAARVRPTESMWREGQRIFPSAIAELEPQLIVVMGKNLRQWFDPPQGIEVCFTEHPSSPSFSYQPWAEHIQSAHSRVVANSSSKRTREKPRAT